jgi:hypothetical protein
MSVHMVIKQFEQRGETLQVTVVRRSGQEEPVLKMRHDLPQQTCAL